MHKIQVRPACWEDRSPVEALEARIKPYRPEEELQLEPMYARALIAERLNDPRWLPLPVSAPRLAPSKTDSFPEMDALWVAIPEEGDSLLGIVGGADFSLRRSNRLVPSPGARVGRLLLHSGTPSVPGGTGVASSGVGKAVV